jgi:hypothetical protein
VEVHYDEGVAIHIGLEPCAGLREDVCEASAGERIGQPLSRERMFSREPTLSTERKATRRGALSRAPSRFGVVADPGMCGSFLYGNREISWSAIGPLGRMVRGGKARSRSHR